MIDDTRPAGAGLLNFFDIGRAGLTPEQLDNSALDIPILGAGSRIAITWSWVGDTATAVITVLEGVGNGAKFGEFGMFDGNGGGDDLYWRKTQDYFTRRFFKTNAFRLRFTITIKLSVEQTY